MPLSIGGTGGVFECEITYMKLLDHKLGRVGAGTTIEEYLGDYTWRMFAAEDKEMCERVRGNETARVFITVSYYGYKVNITWLSS